MLLSETGFCQWWALSLETNGEYKALERIRNFLSSETELYDFFHPRRLILEYRNGSFQLVEKTLYPGYSFIQCPKPLLSALLMQRPSGFYSIVKIGNEIRPVYNEEIANIKHLVGENGVAGISEGKIIDKKLRIASGPLVGYEAEILKISKRKHRVKIETTLGNRKIQLELACLIS